MLLALQRKKYKFIQHFALFFFFAGGLHASAADLSLSPRAGTYTEGKSFTVDISISGNTQTINAVSASLRFPTDLIQVKSISKDGSIIKLWAEEPTFSNVNGTIKLEGVVLNPGFSSQSGKVLSVTFTAKKAGSAGLSMVSGSVLANDGNATDVTGTLGSGSYDIKKTEKIVTEEELLPSVTTTQTKLVAPALRSSTHGNQDGWYASRDISFEWVVPAGVTAIRTLYDQNPESSPTKVYDPPINNRSFTVDADGTYYMHAQFKNKDGWGPIAHYRFNVDTETPEKVLATLPDGSITTNPEPLFSVVANDSTSGIDHITLAIPGKDPVIYQKQETNLYKGPKLFAGNNTVTIVAYDRAGNSTKAFVDVNVTPVDPPSITDYTKYATEGDLVKVSGSTYPYGTVEISFVDRNGKASIGTMQANERGDYAFVSTAKLLAGVYEIKARTIDSKGTASEFAQTKVLVVEKVALIRIGMFVMNVLSLALIIVIASISFIATLWFSIIQFARFRRKIKRTITEVENTVKTNVQALRRDTEEFRTILVKAEKKRELTKEEQLILKKFNKRLEIVEQEIEKKLEQIG